MSELSPIKAHKFYRKPPCLRCRHADQLMLKKSTEAAKSQQDPLLVVKIRNEIGNSRFSDFTLVIIIWIKSNEMKK